jgi:hypothetical protein
MTTPMPLRCSKVITAIADPERDKILMEEPHILGVPINAAAASEDRERHERLAKKYGVKLPEKPKERMSDQGNVTGGYYVRAIPTTMGGDSSLESSLSSRLKKIMPFWWPVQPEEWDLDYWTSRGFGIFIVTNDGKGFLPGAPMDGGPLRRSFYQQIRERCELVAALPNARPLFGERDLKIYRLRGKPSGEQVSRSTPPAPRDSSSRPDADLAP